MVPSGTFDEDVPVIVGSRQFPVRAVGTSYCREAIAKLSTDPARLVFLSVVLVPYDTNPHDPHAVAVASISSPERPGHLPADLARKYRQRVMEAGLAGPAICSAVIGGGGEHDGEQWHYGIELDIDLHQPLRFAQTIIEAPTSEPRFEWMKRQHQGVNIMRCWMSQPLDSLHPRLKVRRWARPEWTDAGYYLANRQGIGFGLRLCRIDLTTEREVFGTTDISAEVMELDGRWATIHLQARSEFDPHPEYSWTGGRPELQLFLFKEQFTTLQDQLTACESSEQKIEIARGALEVQRRFVRHWQSTDEGEKFAGNDAGLAWVATAMRPIQALVRSLIGLERAPEARAELDAFLAMHPELVQTKSVHQLENSLERAEVRGSKKSKGAPEAL